MAEHHATVSLIGSDKPRGRRLRRRRQADSSVRRVMIDKRKGCLRS